MELLQSSYFALFLIIALGFILGKISFKGLSLGISAVIFVALVFGHFGIRLNKDLQQIGLVLFIFTVGIQAGPGFIKSIRDSGGKLILMASIVIVIGAITTLLLSWAFGIDMNIAIGLFTGALTSTPGLAAAIDITGSSLSSIGYGVAYPFGVIGVILFMKIFPQLIRVDTKKANAEIEKQRKLSNPEIYNKHFRVENSNLFGQTLQSLKIRSMTGATISRICHDNVPFIPMPNSCLHKDDLVKAVGTKEALDKLGTLIGSEVSDSIPLSGKHDVQSILVTNKDVVNKSIKQLNLMENFNATVTRIRRSSIDIVPSSDTQILFGDKLMVASDKENMKGVIRLLGNSEKKLSDTDFFPIATGITLGVLAGKISIVFPSGFAFSPGLTGGVLLIALILGSLGKTGPIMWSMSGAANQLIRQIGLLLFLSVVGTSAGAQIADTFQSYGIELFLVGGLITLIPLILAFLIGHYLLKINLFENLGALTGGMTSTPGLAAVGTLTDSNIPSKSYATVYPAAMVLLIICVQLLTLLG